MTRQQRMLRFVFFGSALVFVASLPLYPYRWGWAIKTIPVVSLALLASISVPGLTGKLLSVALLFSAAGDAALGLNDLHGGGYFVLGLGLFLVAQLVYVITFARGFQAQRSRVPLAVLLILYSVSLALILRPGLGDLQLPVFVYIVVITAMGVLAALRVTKGNTLALGAVAFMLSDSLIAINKFLMPIPGHRFWTIITYFFAQYMITQAFIQDT
jgi:uncharacterized membrane protein YhhN